MQRAIAQLTPAADSLLIDFVKLSNPLPQRNLVRGDAVSFSIAAASIPGEDGPRPGDCCLGRRFPEFGLASNKGYSAPCHLEAVATGSDRPRCTALALNPCGRPIPVPPGRAILLYGNSRGTFLVTTETFEPQMDVPRRHKVLRYCFALFTLEGSVPGDLPMDRHLAL